jgi:hypothetical protein
MQGAAGVDGLSSPERLLLVMYLTNDADEEVRGRAVATLRNLPLSFLEEILSDPDLHPRLLDVLVKFHAGRPELAPLFLAHPSLTEAAASFLAARGVTVVPPQEAAPEEEGELDEEEFQSKYQMAQNMGISEKIKMGLTGDKEWRTILIKDSNKLVSGAVIKNPRLTEGEVLTIAKSAVQNDDVMRVICSNKEWVKNYQIRKALVENHKTPLPAALRFVATLSDKDLASLAKSKNVSSVVASQARRTLLSKSKGK